MISQSSRLPYIDLYGRVIPYMTVIHFVLVIFIHAVDRQLHQSPSSTLRSHLSVYALT
jgi:hypothetical protein